MTDEAKDRRYVLSSCAARSDVNLTTRSVFTRIPMSRSRQRRLGSVRLFLEGRPKAQTFPPHDVALAT
jgi:hypothetical protein